MGIKAIITEDLKLQVKNLFDQKKGTRVISKELGITRWAVQQIYKELGIYNIGIKTPRKPIPQEKSCKTCKIIKSINNFRQRVKGTRISYEPYCLPCEKQYQVKTNPIKYQKNKQWHINYRKANKSQINKKRRDKLNADPAFKLRTSVSTSINRHLRKRDGSKNYESCSKYLPFEIEFLMIHLQSLFESWMNWQNWGNYRLDKWDDNDSSTWTWQIDHIIPAELFKYKTMEDEEFKKCWALSNLRPYSAKQNIIDGTTKIRHK